MLSTAKSESTDVREYFFSRHLSIIRKKSMKIYVFTGIITILILIKFTICMPVHPAIKNRVKNSNVQDTVSMTQPTQTAQVTERPVIDNGEETKKRFTCDFPRCKFASANKSNYKIHKRIHTGQKPFLCDYPECEFAAAQKGNLDKHKRSHTGEKPYHCDHPGCKFASRRSDHLILHKMTHKEGRLLLCDHPDC